MVDSRFVIHLIPPFRGGGIESWRYHNRITNRITCNPRRYWVSGKWGNNRIGTESLSESAPESRTESLNHWRQE